MMGVHPHDSSDYPEFVEVDPTGRYGRYNEVLGKGASKTVYRAFDECEGMEVAWNQVKLYDFLQSPDDLERLYCEIHLLKTLKHKNIMKFYSSWVDISKRNINFVTEMFTSGTLRQYRQMHRRVHIRAVKRWCRQILMGLLYLHSHDPPIIHRDLKCDNIFINGNQGEVKIGDLGLAAILRQSHAVHCVGTPEFMAPEVYEEEYNELVDIYSFGMCVLEMVTFEYPYSECSHPAQIYKKVISGAKPDALYRVKDREVRQFIEKCLATVSQRLSARELLMDPFIQTDGLGSGSYSSHPSTWYLVANGSSGDLQQESEMDNDLEDNSADYGKHGIDLFSSDEDEEEEEPIGDVDITIKGRKGDDGGIFIRLRIGDNEGHVRNIYFPFDIDTDTALGVAAEMVDELDITDHEVARIAEMIDGEVSSLVPKWKTQMGLEEMVASCCHDCESNASSCGSHLDYLAMSNSCCSHLGSFDMHGQFEEITYQGEVSEQSVMEGEPVLSSRQSDGLDVISQGSEESHSNEDGGDEGTQKQSGDSENKVPQDPRWMKLMYQTRVKDFRKRLLGRRAVNLSLDLDKEPMVGDKCEGSKVPKQMKSFHLGRRFSFRRPDVDTEHFPSSQPDEGAQRPQDQAMNPHIALEKIFAAKSYYIGDSLPTSLPRARSLCI